MTASSSPRLFWSGILVAIIALGILSRRVHTGLPIFDKYLGDGLYAAMVYAILRLRWHRAAATIGAGVIMLMLESFQLTMIPAHMLLNQHWFVRICARLLGTEFSFLDLLAYAVGIGCIHLADFWQFESQ